MRRTADELRERVRELRRQGLTLRAIVGKTGVSVRSVCRFCRTIKRKRKSLRAELVVLQFSKYCRRCNDKKTVFENITRLCAECYASSQVQAGKVVRETV